MSFHSLLTGLDIHRPNRWSYADATAREAATGFTSDDVTTIALQEDDNSLWLLTATTPTWQAVGGSGSSAAVVASYEADSNSQTFTDGVPTEVSFDFRDTDSAGFYAGSLPMTEMFVPTGLDGVYLIQGEVDITPSIGTTSIGVFIPSGSTIGTAPSTKVSVIPGVPIIIQTFGIALYVAGNGLAVVITSNGADNAITYSAITAIRIAASWI